MLQILLTTAITSQLQEHTTYSYSQKKFHGTTDRALDFLVVDSHSCLRDSMPSMAPEGAAAAASAGPTDPTSMRCTK